MHVRLRIDATHKQRGFDATAVRPASSRRWQLSSEPRWCDRTRRRRASRESRRITRRRARARSCARPGARTGIPCVAQTWPAHFGDDAATLQRRVRCRRTRPVAVPAHSSSGSARRARCPMRLQARPRRRAPWARAVRRSRVAAMASASRLRIAAPGSSHSTNA